MLNKLLLIIIFCGISGFTAKAQTVVKECPSVEISAAVKVQTKELTLVDNKISIKIYTKERAGRIINKTFVVVHNNECKGLNAVKEVLSDPNYYGRLIEIVSNYKDGYSVNDPGNERRYLYFNNGKSCVDPNRIYTENGRNKALKESKCSETPSDNEINLAIKSFADNLLDKYITVNDRYNFIIGVHNNDPNGKCDREGLSVDWWAEHPDEIKSAVGIFKTAGKFKGKQLTVDDFILVSNANLFSQFFNLSTPFNIALQQERRSLIEITAGKTQIRKGIDDGSMSIYFGATSIKGTVKAFSYINVEGRDKQDENDNSKFWQKEIIKMIITKIKS